MVNELRENESIYLSLDEEYMFLDKPACSKVALIVPLIDGRPLIDDAVCGENTVDIYTNFQPLQPREKNEQHEVNSAWPPERLCRALGKSVRYPSLGVLSEDSYVCLGNLKASR